MNLGLGEMAFLFVLGLLLFGPKRLPEIGRQLGKALAEFKRASHEFQSQLNEEVRKLELETAAEAKPTAPVSGQIARGPVEHVPVSETAVSQLGPFDVASHAAHGEDVAKVTNA